MLLIYEDKNLAQGVGRKKQAEGEEVGGVGEGEYSLAASPASFCCNYCHCVSAVGLSDKDHVLS